MIKDEIAIGSMAPEFRLPAHSGVDVALADYRGRKVVLFFVREYN